MIKSALLVLYFLFLQVGFIYSDIYFAGRGDSISAQVWDVKKNDIKNKKLLAMHGELFTVVKSKLGDVVYYGGALNNSGVVWERNLQSGEVKSFILPESRIIYALLSLKDGTIFAAGTHNYKGGYVWKKEYGKEWKKISRPPQATVITSLLVDNGKVFAGGFAKTDGKIWIFSDGEWNNGFALNSSAEINTLIKSKEIIYAAGLKKNAQGGVWKFNGNSWQEGTNLKFSHYIYASAVGKDGVVYLVGAGDENKVLWENSQGFWNAVELDDCLAIYAIHVDQNNYVYAAGWNKSRKGKFWLKKKKWNKGKDIKGCFVIRGIS